MERRLKISNFIIDGLKPYQIKEKLSNISIDTIYDDIKHIKKKSFKTITKLSGQGLAFQYDNMTQQIDLIYSESRKRLNEQLNNNELSNDDFIKLSKLNKECITEKRELIKECLSVFEIENLKQEVKELKALSQGDNVKSFMNVELPKLIHDNKISK